MINYLKEVYIEDEHDGFIFIVDEKDNLDISAFTYKKRGKPVETHEDLGYKYHILTYREDFENGDGIKDVDLFEAILGNPHHYASNLIKLGFFGTICKKTKYSSKVINGMFKELKKEMKNKNEK